MPSWSVHLVWAIVSRKSCVDVRGTYESFLFLYKRAAGPDACVVTHTVDY